VVSKLIVDNIESKVNELICAIGHSAVWIIFGTCCFRHRYAIIDIDT
jgi:hypothetical protein